MTVSYWLGAQDAARALGIRTGIPCALHRWKGDLSAAIAPGLPCIEPASAVVHRARRTARVNSRSAAI